MTTDLLKTKAGKDFVTELLINKFYKNEELLLDEALESLLTTKENLRREVAVEAYLEDKSSLWGAAEIAKMSLEEFKKLLSERNIKIVSS